MAYMHSRDVAHRDLRTPNLFLVSSKLDELAAAVDAGEPIAKVADFGLSSQLVPTMTRELEAWMWMAPETRSSDVHGGGGGANVVLYTPACDVCTVRCRSRSRCYVRACTDAKTHATDSYGMVWVHLLTHRLPFSEFTGRESWDVRSDIVRVGLRPTLPPRCAPHLIELIRRMWHGEPAQRPSFAQIIVELELPDLDQWRDVDPAVVIAANNEALRAQSSRRRKKRTPRRKTPKRKKKNRKAAEEADAAQQAEPPSREQTGSASAHERTSSERSPSPAVPALAKMGSPRRRRRETKSPGATQPSKRDLLSGSRSVSDSNLTETFGQPRTLTARRSKRKSPRHK